MIILRRGFGVEFNNGILGCLSRASKEILLKIVAQPMPDYGMSIFLLLTTFSDDIKKLMK